MMMMEKPAIRDKKEERWKLNRKREKMVNQVEGAISNGNLRFAAKICKEIADICFELGDFEIGLKFIEQRERITTTIKDDAGEVAKYRYHLENLQEKALKAFFTKDFKRAKNLIKQMLAIAEAIGNIQLIKNYKKNLKKVNKLLNQS